MLPGGFQICGARANVGPGNEPLTYTPPGKLYTDTFQANSCASTAGNDGLIPLTATITYNGINASQTVCITVTPPAP
jgi:hypothetical protein